MSKNQEAFGGEIYFVMLTVVGWIDIFTREKYADRLIENLKYCQFKEGLKIYVYVFMLNQIHNILRRESNSFNLTESNINR